MIERAAPVSSHAPRPASTTTADGTSIGWWSLGEGPGLVVVHGSMQSGRSQLDLATSLADRHTVHLMDRRGRGLSAPAAAGPGPAPDEAHDVAAVLRATGSRDVFGVSSGGILALRAALSLPDVRRVGVFEPPISVGGSIRADLLDRFDRECAAGDLVDCMVTAMLAAEMGPPIMLRLPRWVLRSATRRLLARDDARDSSAAAPHVRELAEALPADLRIVRDNADSAGDFAGLRAQVLLLAGSRTRPYLHTAVDALAGVLPDARRLILPGTNHAATQNRDQWGAPDVVAPALAEFFGGPAPVREIPSVPGPDERHPATVREDASRAARRLGRPISRPPA